MEIKEDKLRITSEDIAQMDDNKLASEEIFRVAKKQGIYNKLMEFMNS